MSLAERMFSDVLVSCLFLGVLLALLFVPDGWRLTKRLGAALLALALRLLYALWRVGCRLSVVRWRRS